MTTPCPTAALDAIDSVVENVDIETAIVNALDAAGFMIVPKVIPGLVSS